MRLRTKVDDVTIGVGEQFVNCSNSGGLYPPCPQGTITFEYTKSEQFLAMVDVVTPDYAKRSAAGEIINSPMATEEISILRSPGLFRHDSGQKSDWISQNVHGYHEILAGVDCTRLLTSAEDGFTNVTDFLLPFQSEREIAITSAHANIDESEMLALATIGELPETLRWFASVIRRLITVLAMFKAKRVRLMLKRMSTKQRADAILDFWMECRYAIRPLMFEAQQIAEVMNRETKPMRKTARGYHEVTNIDEQTVVGSPTYTGSPSIFPIDVVTKTTRKSTYRAGVLYEIGLASGTDEWIAILGVDKPLESIYELTKLSFAVDWIFNLGDVLASWTPNRHLTPQTSWIVEEHNLVTVTSMANYAPIATPTVWFNLLQTVYPWTRTEHRLLVRTPCPPIPVFPHVKINLDAAKVVDLVVIARNIYRALTRS